MKIIIDTFKIDDGLLVKITNDTDGANAISFVAKTSEQASSMLSDYLELALNEAIK